MPRKLSPEQSAKIKALFRAALSLPDGVVIPKPTPSECESLKVLLFAEKKSWLTSDPQFHAEVSHLTVRLEKDQKGHKVGVRIVAMPDPTAGLEVFIAQAQLKAQSAQPEKGISESPLSVAIAEQKARQSQELNGIERELEARLRSLGLSEGSAPEGSAMFNYSEGSPQ